MAVSTDPAVDTHTAAVAALPVAIEVAAPTGGEVRRHVEGVLGWQPVDEATAALVPPALRLVDADAVPDDRPTLLLAALDADPVGLARAAARLRPAEVLAWPADRERLAAAAARALSRPAPRDGRPARLVVTGAAGGVGASTVAVALAGLAAWQGARTLLLADPRAPIRGLAEVAPAGLGLAELAASARAVPGVPGLRAVGLTGFPHHAPPPCREPAEDVELVVVDGGRGDDGDVLVVRPEHGDEPAAAGAVVVNLAEARRPPARVDARRVRLPSSARVARAVAAGRVPGALPGRWLRPLAGLTGELLGAPPRPG